MRLYLVIFLLSVTSTSFAYLNRGKVDSLRTLVESSVKGKTEPDTLYINRLNKLAANYFESNPDSTLYYGNKSVDLSRKINYRAGIADGLLQAGHAQYFKGRFLQARQNFDEAIQNYKSIKDEKGLSNCYMHYGKMYNLLADYKKATDYLNLAIELNLKQNNEHDLAECYKNLGIVNFSEGQLSTALDYYYKALYLDLKLNNKHEIAANYNDIGVVLQNMEVYPKADEYFRHALKIFQANKDIQATGTVNENIGEILLAQKKYDEAIVYLTKSINIALKQDDKEGIMSVYTDLGVCYANKGDYKLALNYLDMALKIADKYKNVYNKAYTVIGYATVYNLRKDYKNAYKYAVQGEILAVKLGNLAVRANASLQLSQTLAGLGRFDEAYKMVRQFLSLKYSLNNNESIQRLTSYNLEFDFAAKKKKLADQQQAKELSYRQRIKQQRLINTVFLTIIVGMIAISVVYYRQKRKQQKINYMLADRNREVLLQKANIDDQATKLNDLNTLKDRLISVLAHDLRAPLSTLRGLFSLLQDESISHGQLLEMIPSVLKKLEYTSDFLDTLLFWINSQMDNFESSSKSFYIKDIVTYETESYHEQAALKGITLIDSVPETAVASADPNSIRIVIRNLITNAIKFSRNGDTIEITAIRQNNNNYVISVKDTGMGMTDEQLNKLFKSKVNSNVGTNNESGTGMGMLFCKDLVEKCSGRIWVTSKQGKGTQFSFTVPMGVLNEADLELV